MCVCARARVCVHVNHAAQNTVFHVVESGQVWVRVHARACICAKTMLLLRGTLYGVGVVVVAAESALPTHSQP